MAVEPVTSQNTTVTVLRTSWRPGGASGAEHAGQKAKSSGDSRPQLAHVSTIGAYATCIPRTSGGACERYPVGSFGSHSWIAFPSGSFSWANLPFG